jgi:hypothetical protein
MTLNKTVLKHKSARPWKTYLRAENPLCKREKHYTVKLLLTLFDKGVTEYCGARPTHFVGKPEGGRQHRQCTSLVRCGQVRGHEPQKRPQAQSHLRSRSTT